MDPSAAIPVLTAYITTLMEGMRVNTREFERQLQVASEARDQERDARVRTERMMEVSTRVLSDLRIKIAAITLERDKLNTDGESLSRRIRKVADERDVAVDQLNSARLAATRAIDEARQAVASELALAEQNLRARESEVEALTLKLDDAQQHERALERRLAAADAGALFGSGRAFLGRRLALDLPFLVLSLLQLLSECC